MLLLTLALAPAAALMMFFYLKDRYDPEPKLLVARVFLAGAAVFVPVLAAEMGLSALGSGTLYSAFVVAALPEETFKLLAVRLTGYRYKNFDEEMDGIVYSTAGSLGFATVENVIYVLQTGAGAGVLRAVLSVPGHALFGVAMGYHLGKARFAADPRERARQAVMSLVVPILLHGAYDTLLMSGKSWLIALVVPLMVYMWVSSLHQIRTAEENSPFRPPHLRFGGLFKNWRPRGLVRRTP
ncbi:MAG: PrsW family glutamic-type intramembrane protease [Actinobacteria bacterium]|nr:PrsW family glutamic-type intramembrane protease [Actinomycetota bacterium]